MGEVYVFSEAIRDLLTNNQKMLMLITKNFWYFKLNKFELFMQNMYYCMEKDSNINSNSVYLQSKIKSDINVNKSVHIANNLVKIALSKIKYMMHHLPTKKKILLAHQIIYDDDQYVLLDDNDDVNKFACSLANFILDSNEVLNPDHVYIYYKINPYNINSKKFTIDTFFSLNSNCKNNGPNKIYEKLFEVPECMTSKPITNYFMDKPSEYISDKNDKLKETLCF